MSVAVQATLQGMPEPSDLRRTVHDGWMCSPWETGWSPPPKPPCTAHTAVALQMVLRLLAANAEHWLAHQLNTNPPHIPGDPRPITYTITTP